MIFMLSSICFIVEGVQRSIAAVTFSNYAEPFKRCEVQEHQAEHERTKLQQYQLPPILKCFNASLFGKPVDQEGGLQAARSLEDHIVHVLGAETLDRWTVEVGLSTQQLVIFLYHNYR